MANQNHTTEKRYGLLARNMILVVVIVSFIPLILTGVIILDQFSSAYHQKVFEHMNELVEKHSQNIDSFLTDRLGDIRVLARSCHPDELASEDFLNQKLRLLREEYGGVYVDLGFVDPCGIQVAYAGPFNLQGANYSDAEWFRKTMQSQYYISDVFTGLRGTPHFILAVKQSRNGMSYILRATIDFEAFNSLVENIRIGKTGFAFILNRLGEFQTKPRFEVELDQPPYRGFLTGQTNPERINVVTGSAEGGHKSIVAMAPLKAGQWVLCLQQEQNDAFALLRQTQVLALIVFLIGGLVIVGVAFFLSKRMVNRIAEADEQKEVMNEQVIEAGRLASIGELAAGIAHEINNPVAIMVEEAGWIEDLLGDKDPGSDENMTEIQRAVMQIKTQGSRCKTITHKLLSFARNTDPQTTEVNLNLVAKEIIDLLQQRTRYANVQIETYLAPGLPNVAAPPSELQQVLLNLVNNAVDAMDSEGGTVSITTRVDNGDVFIDVADSGQGIPEANLIRIFDPFFTTKPVGQGTGLGLSICHGIINKLGGEITVRSEMGVGTVFIIRLPAVPAEDQNPQGPESSRESAASQPNRHNPEEE